ncbi:uncharacterized protein PFL1_06036 [Pseudozyma flocculosa PF-1]|uniref:Uncharacterized protein n=1 Tax=Pseudozyma flocculosa PF-1 TaxID=1277687 RepID=A0A061H1Y6_9BASI|nr:uncharacterized protein PFL1_06036 [Pseudozyma flocculosa PF-1]EPQ26388.1 hypothetical protein PFL1_06036 [Pseudozyma flocculosa PF-1]
MSCLITMFARGYEADDKAVVYARSYIMDPNTADAVGDGFVWSPTTTRHICKDITIMSDFRTEKGVIRHNTDLSGHHDREMAFELVGKMSIIVTQPDGRVKRVSLEDVIYCPEVPYNYFSANAIESAPSLRFLDSLGPVLGRHLVLADGTILRGV